MRKIISFSVWGSNPKYIRGAIENAKLQPEIYPGWACRFYIDKTVAEDQVQILKDFGSEIVVKPKSDGNYGIFWRFEPLKDITIQRFIVRDADSRLNKREAAAVKEWEESDKEFHLMRDNVEHAVYICGGMWGATSKFIERIYLNYDRYLESFIKSYPFWHQIGARGRYFYADQRFLWAVIWPMISNSHMAHIANIPKLRICGNERLFPMENEDGTFVGQPIDDKK
jgi:hypothetical protein